MEHQRQRTNQQILLMDYIFTFLVYLIEILQKRYKGLFIEAMSPSGNKWIKKYKPKKVSSKRKKSNEFIIDETQIKIGSQYIWLWVAINWAKTNIGKYFRLIYLSSERTMLVAERFIASLINKFGKCPVSTDGGTWYPQACQFLDVEHHISIPNLRKALLLKEQSNISKIELKDLMIIFHVERRSVS